MADLGLLGIFAHPDDEQVMSGALARAAAEGIRTGLICATRGEAGEIADPALATRENLGKVREGEMRHAAAVLGVKYLWFLDYRDSGMMGTPDNDDPACFYRCGEDEALEKIVKIIREFKPTVIVTFDPTGGYGHPDHLTAHKLATEAFDAAADPARFPEAGEAWRTSRLYYSSFPRSTIRRFAGLIEENDLNSGFRDMDPEKMGLPDEEITNVLDVKEWVPVKERSLSHHRTQMDPNSPFRKLPPEMLLAWRASEHYALVAGEPLPEGEDARTDLFTGLR
jgi:N-acetyl-1-D-myo-inositol-2-amino-2-deoxy-alpha-D-glucopyranoside deacetylase